MREEHYAANYAKLQTPGHIKQCDKAKPQWAGDIKQYNKALLHCLMWARPIRTLRYFDIIEDRRMKENEFYKQAEFYVLFIHQAFNKVLRQSEAFSEPHFVLSFERICHW